MKKRLIALMICLVMVMMPMLAACGGGGGGGEEAAPAEEGGIKVGLITLHDENSTYDLNFINAFKKEYGISIMSYICKLRIEKAEQMLCKTRKSLKEISFECGFYDQNYFSKTFAKTYGCSPSEYRAKHYQSNT